MKSSVGTEIEFPVSRNRIYVLKYCDLRNSALFLKRILKMEKSTVLDLRLSIDVHRFLGKAKLTPSTPLPQNPGSGSKCLDKTITFMTLNMIVNYETCLLPCGICACSKQCNGPKRTQLGGTVKWSHNELSMPLINHKALARRPDLYEGLKYYGERQNACRSSLG